MFPDLKGFVTATLGNITYVDGLLLRAALQDNGKGTKTREPADPTFPNGVPVKVQMDTLTQAQRPEGYAEDDVRLIILDDGGLPDGRVQDDDMVMVNGLTFAIAGPQLDGLRTHWVCRGVRKSGALT